MFNLDQSLADLHLFMVQFYDVCFIGIGSWAVFGSQINPILETTPKRKAFCSMLCDILILALPLLVKKFSLEMEPDHTRRYEEQ